jgi:hypothetical protein
MDGASLTGWQQGGGLLGGGAPPCTASGGVVVAGDQVGGQRTPPALAGRRGAQRAVTDSPARVLDGTLSSTGALAGTDQDKPDPGIRDHSHKPRTRTGGVPVKAVQQVFSPPGVMPGMLIRPVEMKQVHDPRQAAVTGSGVNRAATRTDR